jgi:hypothetical protein
MLETPADYRMTAASINAQIQGARIPQREAYFKVRRSACGMKRNAEVGRSAKPFTRGEKNE